MSTRVIFQGEARPSVEAKIEAWSMVDPPQSEVGELIIRRQTYLHLRADGYNYCGHLIKLLPEALIFRYDSAPSPLSLREKVLAEDCCFWNCYS
jgi:hypothetical protein